MKKLFKSTVLAGLVLAANSFAGFWTEWQPITDNYFEGTDNSHRIVFTLKENFHSCGWNSAAHIQLNKVGETPFQTYTSVFLTALAAKRDVKVLVDGCVGDRANVTAIKIKKDGDATVYGN